MCRGTKANNGYLAYGASKKLPSSSWEQKAAAKCQLSKDQSNMPNPLSNYQLAAKQSREVHKKLNITIQSVTCHLCEAVRKLQYSLLDMYILQSEPSPNMSYILRDTSTRWRLQISCQTVYGGAQKN